MLNFILLQANSDVHHGEPVATTETSHVASHGVVKHDPSVFGLTATSFVSLAMIVLLLLAFWKGAGKLIGNMLDGRIAAIRAQLDEAAALRRDAEALKAEYATKLSAAQSEVADIRRRAEDEAKAIIAKAEAETGIMIARRRKMAEDRIAVAERDAIEGVRAKAATLATQAAASLIADKNDAGNDRRLIDATIATLGNA